MVLSLFPWMYFYSQTVHVANVPTMTVLLRASAVSREEESGVSSQELAEIVENAAKKRAMDLESVKQNIIHREQIMNNSAARLHKFEHLVNQTPAQYFPPLHWNHFPDIWILGCAKAGTSQLYQILTHHPDLQAFNPLKEFCMDPSHRLNYSQPNEKLFSSLYSFHEFMNRNISNQVSASKKLTVNACLYQNENLLHYIYIQKYYLNASTFRNRKKFIIIVRDPADLLFSLFNFFSIPSLDSIGERQIASWSYEFLDYRSPELFHELVVSGNKSLYGRILIDFLEECFGQFLTWIHLVGRENVLIIRNEDMIPEAIDNRGGLLDQLSNFLGINRDSFDSEVVKSRTNCNDGNMTSRGMDAKCAYESKKSNPRASSLSYPISSHRPILSGTRELVYKIASEACHLLREYYDHVMYDGCVKM
jgi:hypothetical protein